MLSEKAVKLHNKALTRQVLRTQLIPLKANQSSVTYVHAAALAAKSNNTKSLAQCLCECNTQIKLPHTTTMPDTVESTGNALTMLCVVSNTPPQQQLSGNQLFHKHGLMTNSWRRHTKRQTCFHYQEASASAAQHKRLRSTDPCMNWSKNRVDLGSIWSLPCKAS